MAILKSQELDYNEKTGEVKLYNEFLLDPLWKENYLERMAVGKARGSAFPTVASVPLVLLENDPDGRIALNAPFGSPEGRIALKKFLAKGDNYQYRTSTANI